MENDPFLAPAGDAHRGDEAAPVGRRSSRKSRGGKSLKGMFKRSGVTNASGAGLILYPWLVFLTVFLTYTFLYSSYPMIVWAVVVACIAVSLTLGVGAATSTRDKKRAVPAFLCMMSFVAIFLAVWLARLNYRIHLKAYYHDQARQGYTNVLASDASGKYSDASRLTFAAGTSVNTDLSVGFLDAQMYCLAPVVDKTISADITKNEIQFWAVGRNCCEASGRFSCGEVSHAEARGGVVAVPDVHWFAAAKKAEAVWGLKSSGTPIFLEWAADSEAMVDAKWRDGMGFLVAAIVAHLFFSLILGALALLTLRANAARDNADKYGEV